MTNVHGSISLCSYVSTAVRIDPKSALSFAATSVQSAFHFKFTYSRLVRDHIKSMSLFRMALVSNQSGSLFYDYFTNVVRCQAAEAGELRGEATGGDL